MGVRIVSERTNQILPFGELILKRYVTVWVIQFIPVASVVTILNLINVLAIFRENKKCVHDELAGTKVIKVS